MQTVFHLYTCYRYRLFELRGLLGVLQRRQELRHLIHWAQQQRLAGPQQVYTFRLQDEEQRLNQYLVKYPRLTNWTRYFYYYARCLRLLPRQYSRGIAAKYRRTS